jgi:hypothetical protein
MVASVELKRAQAQCAMMKSNLEAKSCMMDGQMEQMKSEIDQETELKKAAMAAATQIEIARINAAAKAGAESSSTPDEGAEANQIMQQLLATQNELLRVIGAPKRLTPRG